MYKVSPITTFDSFHQLWETYIGRDLPEKPLDYSVWGETEADSRNEAIALAEILSSRNLVK